MPELVGPDGRPVSSRPQPPPGGDGMPPGGLPGVRRPDRPTVDSFQNFAASVGLGTPNLSSASTYGFHPITRERTLLEWCYRGSWVCGVAVDSVSDDMTKLGLDWGGSLPAKDGETLEATWNGYEIWGQLADLIKWGRLYGGAIAVLLVDGQDPTTPLRFDTIGKGQFRGLMVFDRWQVEPSLNDLVTVMGPDLGKPKYYRIHTDAALLSDQKVHYSRILRYDGVRLPYWQRVSENLWSISILERLWDRLLAFDSTTQGIAQLVYKAYLRWVKIKDMRELIGSNSQEKRQVLLAQVNFMRQMQTNEGISMIDADDDFGVTTYSFNGLDSVLIQMGQQLAGALQIPLVRLFGQAPVGLNATGESDLRIYFDGIHQQQETRLRPGVTKALWVTARSCGIELPDTFNFQFRPLWQLTPKERSDIAEQVTRTVLSADELGVISRRRSLEELKQQSRETGIFATITDDEVQEADDEPAPMAQPGMGGEMGAPGGGMGQQPSKPGEQQRGRPQPQQPQKRPNPVPPPTIHLHSGGGSSEAA